MSDKFQDKYRIPSARLPGYDYSRQGKYFITICTGGQTCYFGKIENKTMYLSESGEIVQKQWFKTPDIRPDMNLTLHVSCVMPNHFHAIIEIGTNEYNRHNDAFSDYEIYIMYEIYKNVMNSSNGNAHGKTFTDCRNATDCRDAMHGVSTDNDNNSINETGTANRNNIPNDTKTNDKQNQQENNTNSIDPIPSYVYYNWFGPQRKNLASIIRGFKSACTKQIRQITDPNFYWQERYYDHVIRDNQIYWKIRNYIIHNPENWQDDRFFNT